MKKVLLLCCLATIMLSCKKQQEAAVWSKQVIVPCSGSHDWTPASLDNAIRGSWVLYRLETASGQQSVPYRRISIFDGNSIIFDSPGEFGSSLHATYSIEKSGSNFIIHTSDSTASAFLGGYLYVCDPYILCSSSEVDGPDQFYKRD